jgi:predicted small lipoprotein YifL
MMKQTKARIFCLFLTALMLFSLTACGKPEPETPEPATEEAEQEVSSEAKSPKTINANLWDLTYDEADGWVYEEDDFYDDETYSKIILTIPNEAGDSDLINAEIRVSVEDPEYFRDYLTSYGFDEYEYAVNQAYDFTPVGGIDCLEAEGNYWGSPCLRYLSRVEGAGATVFLEIIGEYEDARVDKLLSGLTFNLEDTGNEDGPWYWEGEPFSAQPHSVMVGTYTLSSQWLPITDCIVTKETFDHAAAVTGDQAFLLVDGALKRYDYDGTSLKFAEDIALDTEYEGICADTTGTIWLSDFLEPLISWKDGAQTASYNGPDYVAMHPSGTWGISWFSGPECEKVTLSGGAVATAPIVFKEVDIISHLLVDENHIYVSGSSVSDGKHRVFVYDTAGNLQLTLADSDGGSLGSITFVTETANGYLALDGNMREVVLWTKDGTYIGAADDSDLFGTSYPWFCGGAKLADGSILAIMTEDRADESAMELVAFKLSGF